MALHVQGTLGTTMWMRREIGLEMLGRRSRPSAINSLFGLGTGHVAVFENLAILHRNMQSAVELKFVIR
jgi:hypothetical protein